MFELVSNAVTVDLAVAHRLQVAEKGLYLSVTLMHLHPASEAQALLRT
jgi:hypothetical protein